MAKSNFRSLKIGKKLLQINTFYNQSETGNPLGCFNVNKHLQMHAYHSLDLVKKDPECFGAWKLKNFKI